MSLLIMRCASFGCEGYLSLENNEPQPLLDRGGTMLAARIDRPMVGEETSTPTSARLHGEKHSLLHVTGGSLARQATFLTSGDFDAMKSSGSTDLPEAAPFQSSTQLFSSTQASQGSFEAFASAAEALPCARRPGLAEKAPSTEPGSDCELVLATSKSVSQADDSLHARMEGGVGRITTQPVLISWHCANSEGSLARGILPFSASGDRH